MSEWRRVKQTGKRDANEPGVIEDFEALGATVEKLGTPCDLAVGLDGRSYMVEVKDGNEPLTPAQEKFAARWRGGLSIVRDRSEVPALIKQWQTAGAVERRRLDAHRDDVLSGRTEIV